MILRCGRTCSIVADENTKSILSMKAMSQNQVSVGCPPELEVNAHYWQYASCHGHMASSDAVNTTFDSSSKVYCRYPFSRGNSNVEN